MPLTIASPFFSISRRLFTRTGFRFPNDIAFSFPSGDGFLFFHFFDRDLARSEAKQVLERAAADPDFFRGLEESFLRAGASVESAALSFHAAGFSSDRLRSGYDAVWEETCRFWECSLFIDLLDPYADEVLAFVFGDAADHIAPDRHEVLFAPDRPTHFQRERADLLSIRKRRHESGDGFSIDAALERHALRYYWIRNDYEATPFLDAAYYRDDLDRLDADVDYAARIMEGVRKARETAMAKEEAIRELGLSRDVVERLRFANWIGSYRDDRKKYNQISNFLLVRTAETIGKEFGIDPDELKYLMPDEIPALLSGDRSVVSELSERRRYGLMLLARESERFGIVTGPTVATYYEAIEASLFGSGIVRGSVASRGIARGRVRIIQNQADFPTFEMGDVLVTQMTRPEFLSIISRAAAVVTDEGGITCHAAIISRELGIPCIIGTQTATRVLRDGDLVEVDAEQGLVRSLSEVVSGSSGHGNGGPASSASLPGCHQEKPGL